MLEPNRSRSSERDDGRSSLVGMSDACAAGQAACAPGGRSIPTPGSCRSWGSGWSGMGWQYRVLASPVPLDAMVALRLNAVVVDLAVLGPQGWTYLDKLCARLPGLGVIVCTGQSSVAQRVRGLRLGADDWVTKPCHPEELIARIEAVVRRRKRADVRVEKGPVVIGEVEIRADQFQAFVQRRVGRADPARVRAHPAAGRGRGPGPAARGDLPARVGLRDGPRRPLGRRLRAQAALQARAGLAELALHPHPLRDRLPLLRRAGRGAGRDARSAGPGARAASAPSRRSSPPTNLGPGGSRTATRTCATSRSSSLLAVVVWKVPGGGTAAATISNILSVAFLGGLFFFGYRLYMEHRDDDLRRSRSASAGCCTARWRCSSSRWSRPAACGTRARSAPCCGSRMLGAAGWALYSVWRAYRTY